MKKLLLLFFSILIPVFLFSLDHSGSITADETWTASQNPHIITSDVTINDGITLTIEPGCIVKFNLQTKMYVYGKIIANGTEANHIQFTSNASSPSAGDWRNIQFYNADSGCVFSYSDFSYGGYSNSSLLDFYNSSPSFSHCTIQHSAYNGVYISRNSHPVFENTTIQNNANNGIESRSNYTDVQVSISNCEFLNNGNYPLIISANSVKNVTGSNTFSGNANNYIYVIGQQITGGTWEAQTIPYYISSSITLVDQDTLIIQPGCNFKMANDVGFDIYGTLKAQGNSSEHITFTSIQTAKDPVYWNTIYFYNPDEGCILDYCDFSYGGKSSTGLIRLYRSYDNVTISHCKFEYSQSYGIKVGRESNLHLSNSIIRNNQDDGIYTRISSGTHPMVYLSNTQLTNNNGYPLVIYGNTVQNIYIGNTFTGNTNNQIYVIGDYVDTATWHNFNIPYRISESDINISDNQTLSIDAGTVLKFADNIQFYVRGALIAEGTSSEPIKFTSIYDSTSYRANWRGIYFYSIDDSCKLNHCEISYAGENNQGAIRFYISSNVSIKNSIVENSASSGIYIGRDSSPIIQNCIIRNNAQEGINCETNYGGHPYPYISDTQFDNNGSYPIILYANGIKNLSDTLSFSGNAISSIYVRTDDVNSGTWKNFGIPYFISSNLLIKDYNTLTIEPGTVLKMNENTIINVYGTLIANGTAENHITFTSNQDTPTNGYWDSVKFSNIDSNSSLNYCDFEYGGRSSGEVYCYKTYSRLNIKNSTFKNSGNYGIYLSSYSTTTIDSCLFEDNDSYAIYSYYYSGSEPILYLTNSQFINNNNYPIRTYPNSINHFENLTFTGNLHNMIYIKGQTITENATWKNFGIPYLIAESNLNIDHGKTLSLDPGIELSFNTNLGLYVYGGLQAVGNSSNHIIFTSAQDTPANGDWRNIYFIYTDTNSLLDYCEIKYGGSSDANILFYHSDNNVTIQNSTIEYSGQSGIKILAYSHPTINNCTIGNNNGYGIYAITSSGDIPSPTIQNCIMENNGNYPIAIASESVHKIAETCSFANNYKDAIYVKGGNINTGTWHYLSVPYDIAGDLNIPDGNTLTLEAGDTLRFLDNYTLYIRGTLSAEGTSANHISFTRSPSYSGYWNQVKFYQPDDTCTLSYCDFSYGGSSAGIIYADLDGINLSISDCVIKYSNSSGIYLNGNSSPNIKRTVITNCSAHGINCVSSYSGSPVPTFGGDSTEWNDIFNNGQYNLVNNTSYDIYAKHIYWGYSDTTSISAKIYDYTDDANLGRVIFEPHANAPHYTMPANEHAGLITSSSPSSQLNWTYANGPVHYVIGVVTVDVGTTLNIEDGVIVKFAKDTYIEVNGNLVANGTAGITFTKYEQNVLWKGIKFNSGSQGTLNNCTIEYVQSNDSYAVYSNTPNLSLSNSTVQNSIYGLYLDQYIPSTLSNNTFINNTYGIFTTGVSSNGITSSNTIENNTDTGIWLDHCHDFTINNQTITGNNGNHGAIYAEHCHNFTIGSGNTISNNYVPLSITIASYPSSSSVIPTSGNTNNAILVYGGETDNDINWGNLSLPYIIMENPVILGSNTLTISQNTTLKFENGKKISVYGTIQTNGTAGNEVLFTRNDSTDTWQGIEILENGTANLNHTIIEYATYNNQAAVNATNANITLANCTIRNNYYGLHTDNTQPNIISTTVENNNYAIYIQNTSNPLANIGSGNVISNNSECGLYLINCSNIGTIQNLTMQSNSGYGAIAVINGGDFTVGTNTISSNDWPITINTGSFISSSSNLPTTGNTNNYIRVISNEGTKTGTWYHIPNLPYKITATPIVGNAGNLTIADYDTLLFNNSTAFDINGTFSATGSHILFTSSSRDSWYGIRCLNNSTVVLDSCTITNATSNSESAGIYSISNNVTIRNCKIYGCYNGIYLNGVMPDIYSNEIYQNQKGIYIKDGSGLYLDTANNIHDNILLGIHFYNCSNNSGIENQNLTDNSGTYGAIYFQKCGYFVLGANTITSNSWPLTIDLASYPTDSSLSNIPTSGNTNNNLQIYGGHTYSHSFTWKELPSPLEYVVTDNATISSGDQITIEDQVTVYFKNNSGFYIYGTLNAEGTSSSPVFHNFNNLNQKKTSLRNRTNGILFTRYTSNDTWAGLNFGTSSNGNLQYCTIEYVSVGSGASIKAYNPNNIQISNCTLQHSTYGFYGYNVSSAHLTNFANNTIDDNNIGVYISNTQNFTISSDNTLSNNQTGIIFSYCNSPICSANIQNSTLYAIKFSNCDNPQFTGTINSSTNGVFYERCTSIPTIENISISNANGDYGALRFNNCGQFTIGTGNNISNNSWPLSIDCASFPDSLSNIPTSGNTNNDIQITGGSGNIDGTFYHFSGLDYIVTGNITANGKITIKPGNTFKFRNATIFDLYDEFTAVGTQTQPIIFTSTDSTSHWQGFYIHGISANFAYTTIEYANYNTNSGLKIYNSSSINLDHCTLQNNAYGLYCYNSSVQLNTNNVIRNNQSAGIYLSGNSNATFGSDLAHWNDIYNNSGLNFRNGDNDVTAEYIYWGTTTNSQIESSIYDKTDNSSLGYVDYSPYTNGAHDTEISGAIDTPQNVTITISGNNLQLDWDAVNGATSYKIYSTDDPNSDFSTWTYEGETTSTSWSETLTTETKKFYKVTAIN